MHRRHAAQTLTGRKVLPDEHAHVIREAVKAIAAGMMELEVT